MPKYKVFATQTNHLVFIVEADTRYNALQKIYDEDLEPVQIVEGDIEEGNYNDIVEIKDK